MNNNNKTILSILIISAIIVAILFLIKKYEKEPVINNTETKVDTVYINDTIILYDTIPIIRKEILLKDTIIRDTIIIDSLVDDYYTERYYNDTLQGNLTKVIYNATVFENKLKKIDFTSICKNKVITQNITNTVIKSGLYLGGDVGYNYITIDFEKVTNHDIIYSCGVGFCGKVPIIKIGLRWKILR